ncbi:MAG: hypothetical protein K2H82_10100 [Oscillospiraceae bacterium]|nr:hypothetical protein [Oscillospiraceae bacterium]
MTDEEFIKKMENLGKDSDYINSILRQRDEEKEQGIICPIEVFLIANSYVKIIDDYIF